jgi:transcriptional regulator with XRE-family HTH domain
MSLAQRVRDMRYVRGMGPDELASLAEISRTALYQIETGKTGLPRAATLRRIAAALKVPMEDLLIGLEDGPEPAPSEPTQRRFRRPRIHGDWAPSEGGPLSFSNGAGVKSVSIANAKDLLFPVDEDLPIQYDGHEWIFSKEGELMSKLHDLLHSPIGRGVARIVEELHGVLPRSHSSI